MKVAALILLLCTVFMDRPDYVQVKDAKFENGKRLYFKEQCSSCHPANMRLRGIASALGGITKKREKKWLYEYTRDSYGMLQRGDKMAKEIAKKNGLIMASYPKITDKELDDIYYFVEKTYTQKKP